MLHKKIQLGDIHKIHNWAFNTSVERLAASVAAEDIGKVAWQLDDDTYWVLKSATPVIWNGLNDGFDITELHDVSIVSLTNGQALVYDSVTGTWKNTSISGVGSDTSYPTRLVSADTVISNLDYTLRVSCSTTEIDVALPAATTLSGYLFNIKKIDNSPHPVNIVADGSELIDGSNTVSIGVQYLTLSIQSNGTSWDII